MNLHDAMKTITPADIDRLRQARYTLKRMIGRTYSYEGPPPLFIEALSAVDSILQIHASVKEGSGDGRRSSGANRAGKPL